MAVCVAVCHTANAQNEEDSLQQLAARVERFGTGLPQEKVYLHIDNTCYFVGDTIWYKAYVTRADKGWLTDLSKIMYVELLTPDGYLVERQQLKMEMCPSDGGVRSGKQGGAFDRFAQVLT